VNIAPDTSSTSPPEPGLSALDPTGSTHAAEAHGAGVVKSRGVPGAMELPWIRVLIIGAICFAVWLLLDAPSLQKSAQASPLGSRRTVSLDLVGPVAAVSRGLGLAHVVGWTDDLLGRSVGGGPSLAIATLPINPASKGNGKGNGPTPIAITPTVSTAPTPTTLPPLPRHPTAADPLRVVVIGDSIGIDLGQPLTNDLIGTGVVAATLDGRIDTGLSRPDYFDWPAELRADLANHRPQLVVVMMGANDPQNLVVNGTAVAYGTAGWNAVYSARVGAFMDTANAAGAHLLWVGMPPMAGSQLDGEMNLENGLARSEAAARPARATYLSSRNVLGDGQGNYTAYLTNGSGSEVNIRTPDGIHLTLGGGEVLSQAVMSSIRGTLKIALPG
jgi:lysophospholipase L1-like esterase